MWAIIFLKHSNKTYIRFIIINFNAKSPIFYPVILGTKLPSKFSIPQWILLYSIACMACVHVSSLNLHYMSYSYLCCIICLKFVENYQGVP